MEASHQHEDVFGRAMRRVKEHFEARDVPFEPYHACIKSSRCRAEGYLGTVDGTSVHGAGEFRIESEISCDLYDPTPKQPHEVMIVAIRSADCPWGVGGSFGKL